MVLLIYYIVHRVPVDEQILLQELEVEEEEEVGELKLDFKC